MKLFTNKKGAYLKIFPPIINLILTANCVRIIFKYKCLRRSKVTPMVQYILYGSFLNVFSFLRGGNKWKINYSNSINCYLKPTDKKQLTQSDNINLLKE